MRTTDSSSLSKTRFESFSDGVFAIAITLLILEVRIPEKTPDPATNVQQLHALISIWPQYLVYAASFATIGIMWLNHHALFNNVRRITHGMALANLLLLALVSFLPFTTEVLGRFGLSPIAVVYYGITMVAISLAYNLVLRQVYAAHGRTRPIALWSIVGLSAYPIAAIAGYFAPLLGIIIIALLAVFYMMPSNVRAVTISQEEAAALGTTPS
jgi:uncharacterized membrane protein